jgi:hypothetical protein
VRIARLCMESLQDMKKIFILKLTERYLSDWEGLCVDSESLNSVEPLPLRGNFTGYGKILHLDNDRSALVSGRALCRMRNCKS